MCMKVTPVYPAFGAVFMNSGVDERVGVGSLKCIIHNIKEFHLNVPILVEIISGIYCCTPSS